MLISPQVRAPDEVFGGSLLRATTGSGSALEPSPSISSTGKPLAQLLAAVRAEVRGEIDRPITDVTYRSEEVHPGSAFFCVPGHRVDGHQFAAEACSRGAAVVIGERWLDGIPCAQVRVLSVRAAMGPMSAAFFEYPSRRMTVVGVTGTNGKTTITYLLESIFRVAGSPPGVVGTTGVRMNGRPMPFDRTTPEGPDLQRLLARMAKEGVRSVAMEVSSHGLDQRRVDGTRYRCAVFTNLSQDHLDYHGTMEAYFNAKARLFTPDLSDRAVVNVDVPEGRELAERATVPVVGFGLGPGAEVRATDVEVAASGLAFTVNGVRVRSGLRGGFNVSNCVAAFAAAREVGIDEEAVAAGIEGLAGVPGRLEPVDAGQPFNVLVDYAHSPDSLENVLRSVRNMTAGRVIVVFGCGGDRDPGKRPLMGETATRLADLSVVTSDNPRSEDPEAIIAQIEPGAREGGGAFLLQPDRRAAIRLAIAEARSGDVVLIAGKGHETGQEFRDRTVAFDDREVAAEELRTARRERTR
jgi:UDP-N-acetylmuramoyl-L-alanyl-D-glutamate--2,6-diaminopimelate ligase